MWRQSGLLAVVLLGAGGHTAIAQPLRTSQFVPGMRQADRHNPYSPGYVDMRPLGYARRTAAGLTGGASWSYGNSYYGNSYYGNSYYGNSYYGNGGYFNSPGLPCPDPWCSDYNYSCGFDACCDYGYAPAFGYGFSYFAAPPLILPGEQLFMGPALRQFIANAQVQQQVDAARPIVVVNGAAAANGAVAKPVAVRATNAQQLMLAGKVMGFGDEHFSHQRYREALDRYRKTTETAPDLVEGYFRHAQALLALGKYDTAAASFKRGLKLGPGWTQADFKLAELYGDNQLAQQQHLEAVAEAAVQAPAQGDLLLLVALQLYFSNQQQRAAPFFQCAAMLLDDPALQLNGVAAAQAAAAPVAKGF